MLQTQSSPLGIVTPAELAELLRVTRKTVDRMHKHGKGPRRLQLSPKRVGYRMADVNEWLEKPRALEAA